MLDVTNVWGRKTKTTKSVSAKDTTIRVSNGMMFDVKDNTHYYATLINGDTREVVKVTRRDGDILTVERGQDNTSAQSFPSGVCVKVEWNPQQLCEFIKQCATGDSHKITPALYVLHLLIHTVRK
jgi:hypothetical protein